MSVKELAQEVVRQGAFDAYIEEDGGTYLYGINEKMSIAELGGGEYLAIDLLMSPHSYYFVGNYADTLDFLLGNAVYAALPKTSTPT